jgi:hypothetical protein
MIKLALPARRSFRPFLVPLLILPLVSLAGCTSTDRPNEALIYGKVTFKDQPVGGGTVTLIPAGRDKKIPPIPIGPDGSFQAGGIPVGQMTVTIETESAKKTAGVYVMPNGQPPPKGTSEPQIENAPKYVAIPKKYADPKTSGLSWDIKPGNNDKNFPLD